MTISYDVIPFDEVKKIIEQIFENSSLQSWELVPDQINNLAKSSGIKLVWTPIKNWIDFESGNVDVAYKVFLNDLFKQRKPIGQVIVLTEECFINQVAYQLDSKDLDYFISESYPELHGLDFFQPADIIFVCKEINMISILHHEGQITQFIKKCSTTKAHKA